MALLHEDVRLSMPPLSWWLRGRDQVARTMAAGDSCVGARLLPTTANAAPAFGQYRPTGPEGALAPFALVVLELRDSRIHEITNYLMPELFPLFDLPPVLSAAEASLRR